MATDRIIVHESIADDVLHELDQAARSLKIGDPRDPASEIGPLIDLSSVDRYRRLTAAATSAGAAIVAGRSSVDGRYVSPVVFEGVDAGTDLYRQEAFAPIASFHRFRSDEDARALANDTEYGLIASVLSGDRDRALRLASTLDAGAVHIAGPSVGDEPHVPFGGVGASGFGRLGGLESVRFFTEQRTMYVHGMGLLQPAG